MMVIHPHFVVTMCVIVPFLMSFLVASSLVHDKALSWNLSIEETLVHEYGVLVPEVE